MFIWRRTNPLRFWMFTYFSLLTLFPHFSCFVFHPGTYWNTTDSLKCKQGKPVGDICNLSKELKVFWQNYLTWVTSCLVSLELDRYLITFFHAFPLWPYTRIAVKLGELVLGWFPEMLNFHFTRDSPRNPTKVSLQHKRIEAANKVRSLF